MTVILDHAGAGNILENQLIQERARRTRRMNVDEVIRSNHGRPLQEVFLQEL